MTTNILQHSIEWHVSAKSIKELPSFEEQHIYNLIAEGYHAGELCVSYVGKNGRQYETRGWWEIKKCEC